MDEELKNRGWHELTFLDIAKSLKRGPFGGNLKKAFFVPTGYKVYEQQHAINKDFQLGTYFINDKKYEELKGFAVGSGDYIISCSGTIGKLYRLPKEAPSGVINQALLKITLEDGLLTHSYFSYLFQSAYFQRQILSDARGTGMQNLAGMKEIKVVPVFIPPFPEQRKIVEKLDELISELDNGIANLKAAKDKLEIYRQAVLKKAFEGELTKEWREQNPYSEKDLVELLEYIEDFNSNKSGQDIPRRLPPIDLNDLHELPYGWLWQEAHKICSSVRDGTHDTPKYVDEGIPLVTSKNLKNGVIDMENVDLISEADHEEICKRSAVEENDILYGMIGTIGNPVIVKQTNAFSIKNVGLFKKNESLLIPRYFQYYLSSWIVEHIMRQKELIRGTTQKFVALGGLRVLPIPLPSKKEQEQIIYEIESRLSVCDNILTNIEEGLEKSEALRQSILKQAFEGKLLSEEELEACRKEPDWEPAEQLLARIKNGNETSVKKKKAPAKQAPKKKIHHVEYYKRTLLAAEIVWQLHRQPTLGHLKLQKLIYLCQESGNMQLPTNFLQQAAGPYDPQMARSIDKQLKTKKWFAYRKNELLKYEPLEKAGGHQTDFKKYYAKDINNIQKVIELFRTAKSDQIEIVATLYACWKRIILEKVIFSENLLIRRFYEWSEEKSKYPESRVKKAVEWMREKGIVPVNAGKQTIDE